MAIDQVHDLQDVYRKLLHSMSRPGTISSIQSATARADNTLPCYGATLLCAMTLLDAEVTYHILSDDQQNIIEKISEYTLAKYVPVAEADYIFVLQGTTESYISSAMADCKNGSLNDPQHSSTWIIESSHLATMHGVTLSGLGIKSNEQLEVGYTPLLWDARKERTKEYPLGIDIIFTDDEAQLVCVPRTTSVAFTEVK